MGFLFKVTSVVNGLTTAIHFAQKPLSRDKKGKGQYLRIVAVDEQEAIKKLKEGPKGNDIWEFVQL